MEHDRCVERYDEPYKRQLKSKSVEKRWEIFTNSGA